MKLEKELKGLAKSFTFAFRGMRSCVNGERNMRIHLTVTFFMFLFSGFYNFTKAEYAILILSCGLVIGAEMMNTAVETVVDMVSPSYSKMAMIAKDIAAGAVFICAFASLCVGVVMFFDINVIKRMIEFFIDNPLLIAAVLVLVVAGILFIFGGIKIKKKNKVTK